MRFEDGLAVIEECSIGMLNNKLGAGLAVCIRVVGLSWYKKFGFSSCHESYSIPTPKFTQGLFLSSR